VQADVLVVGGGPAGLATAIAARLQNLRVTLTDFGKPPIDKPCGEGLLPEAVSALSRLGIELDSNLGFPLAGFRFSDQESSVNATIPKRRAFGLRRTLLQQLLIDRASELGVSFLWGAKISGLCVDGARVNDDFLPCKWIVGADGQHSSVRRLAGLGARQYRDSRFGFRRHYAIAPWSDLVEVHWGRKLQMVVTPTSAREICVSLFSSDSRVRLGRAFEQFPEVAARLGGAEPVSEEAGAVTSFGRAARVARGNVALVGDAGCAVDAVAGQGLSLAFRQSLALAKALAREDLAFYESEHSEIIRTPVRMTKLLRLMNANSTLRRKVLRFFAARPERFAEMISVHTGRSSGDVLNSARIVDLGWRVLWA